MMRLVTLLAGARALFLGNLVSAAVGAALVAVFSARATASRGVEADLLLIFVVAGPSLALVPRQPWSEVLSDASGRTLIAAASALAALLARTGGWLGMWPAISIDDLLTMWASSSAAGAAMFSIVRWARLQCPPLRLAVVGSADSAAELAKEVARSRPGCYEVVGCVADAGVVTGEVGIGALGELAELSTIIAADELELLVLAPGACRLRVYDELANSCLGSSVRIADLDDFYDRAFGHVPIRAINSCWFQHLLAVDRPPNRRLAKRATDLVVAAALGIATAPLLVLLVLLIRRDGGPALFRQQRIGEGGGPFMIIKLRTMHVQGDPEERWTAPRDPRITGLGRILRATHVDELPQLLNVFRGEMSIVGPRPEQPALARRLEKLLPHYQSRHLVKPGIAGWAQARCGYGGSEDGSTWKICHDLYYLRHHSIRFDIAILIETLYALLLGDRLPSRVGSTGSLEETGGRPFLQLPSLESTASAESSPVALDAVARVIGPVVPETIE